MQPPRYIDDSTSSGESFHLRQKHVYRVIDMVLDVGYSSSLIERQDLATSSGVVVVIQRGEKALL